MNDTGAYLIMYLVLIAIGIAITVIIMRAVFMIPTIVFNLKQQTEHLKLLASKENHLKEYFKYSFWGDSDQAIFKLKDAFWAELWEIKSANGGVPDNLAKYSKLKEKYNPAFLKYDITVPEWDGKL